MAIPVYDNTPTVVVVRMVTALGKLVLVRRANDPGVGLLGLPGGYRMRGETWQEAGAREVREETGYIIPFPNEDIRLASLVTDEYGNNLIIADCVMPPETPEASFKLDPFEVQELVFLDRLLPLRAFASPCHYKAVREHFYGNRT